MSAFSPERLAYLEAHRNDSRVHEIHWAYSVPIAVSVLSTGLRLWAKKAGRNGITLDDYLISFATVCTSNLAIVRALMDLADMSRRTMRQRFRVRTASWNGQACHCRVASRPHDLPKGPSRCTLQTALDADFGQGDYVFSHFYDIALVSVKLGILAFYYRIFVVPLFRKIVLATAAFVLAWGIGITVTLALVCRPIAAFWDDTVKGTCLNLATFTYFTNISNLITDIWIFLMPVPVIWHLQLQTKKKLMLCFIFCMGLGYVQAHFLSVPTRQLLTPAQHMHRFRPSNSRRSWPY
jgi:hypothetical protein